MNDDPSAVVINFVDPEWNFNPEQVLYSSFADCFLEWRFDWDREGRQPGVAPEGWTQEAQSDFETIDSAFESTYLLSFLDES